MLHYNPRHVSSSTLLIFTKTNCIITASGIVTLYKRLYSMPGESRVCSHPACCPERTSTARYLKWLRAICSTVTLLLNLDVRYFDLSRAPILIHLFDLPWLVPTKCDETTWLASRLPHSPAIAEITGSSVKLCSSLSEFDYFRTLWNQNPFSHIMYIRSENVLMFC
jgi:hypothetical protein